MDLKEAIATKLATANRILVNENLTELGRGHVCYRLDEDRVMIPGHLHDFHRSIADCTASDMVVIDGSGNVVEGHYPESMHEFFFYLEAFRMRKELKAALHMHAFYTNLLAMAGKTLSLVSRDSFPFAGGVPVFEGLPLFVNTREMGKAMAEKLGNSRAVIHRGHGAFVVGESIEDVVITAAALERASKKQFMASSLGPLLEYDRDEIARTNTEEIRQEVMEIDWGYFVTRLEKRGVHI